MISKKMYNVIVQRISELENIQRGLEFKLKEVESKEGFTDELLYDKSRIFRDIEETKKLIEINEEFFTANGGAIFR